MHLDASGARGGDGFGMQRAGIAVKHDIGDAMPRQQLPDCGGPVGKTAFEGNIADIIKPKARSPRLKPMRQTSAPAARNILPKR